MELSLNRNVYCQCGINLFQNKVEILEFIDKVMEGKNNCFK